MLSLLPLLGFATIPLMVIFVFVASQLKIRKLKLRQAEREEQRLLKEHDDLDQEIAYELDRRLTDAIDEIHDVYLEGQNGLFKLPKDKKMDIMMGCRRPELEVRRHNPYENPYEEDPRKAKAWAAGFVEAGNKLYLDTRKAGLPVYERQPLLIVSRNK